MVGLPSGVFQPYSGVKNSILFFDNELAKQKVEILFVKITHDGTDLGAKRRIIEANDLPTAFEAIQDFQKGKFEDSKIAHSVSKQIIIDIGIFQLIDIKFPQKLRANLILLSLESRLKNNPKE